jgi:hypothetical protein
VTRTALHRLKTAGYLTSSASVFLLATVSWASAQKSLILTACLVAGAIASIVGMFCRWLTYELEKRKERPGPPSRGPAASSPEPTMRPLIPDNARKSTE